MGHLYRKKSLLFLPGKDQRIQQLNLQSCQEKSVHTQKKCETCLIMRLSCKGSVGVLIGLVVFEKRINVLFHR